MKPANRLVARDYRPTYILIHGGTAPYSSSSSLVSSDLAEPSLLTRNIAGDELESAIDLTGAQRNSATESQSERPQSLARGCRRFRAERREMWVRR